MPDSSKLVFASEDAAVIYDFNSRKAITLTRAGERARFFNQHRFSPNSKSISVFPDEAVQTWDVEKRKLIRTWKLSGSGFFGNVSPEGNYVIAGGGPIYGKKAVDIWKTLDQKKIGELSEFRSDFFAMAISHSEKLFALAGGDYGLGGDLSF